MFLNLAIQFAVAIVVAILTSAAIEVMRRLGFDPVSRLARLVSRRDANGTPITPNPAVLPSAAGA